MSSCMERLVSEGTEHDPDGGCSGCPFLNEQFHAIGDGGVTEYLCRLASNAPDDAFDPAPSWCPLRIGPVTVSPTGSPAANDRLLTARLRSELDQMKGRYEAARDEVRRLRAGEWPTWNPADARAWLKGKPPPVHLVAHRVTDAVVSLRCENGCNRYVGPDRDTDTPGVYRTHDGARYAFDRALATCPKCAAAEQLITLVEDGHGNEWERCPRSDCGLHVCRPGKAQCHHPECKEDP